MAWIDHPFFHNNMWINVTVILVCFLSIVFAAQETTRCKAYYSDCTRVCSIQGGPEINLSLLNNTNPVAIQNFEVKPCQTLNSSNLNRT